LKLYELWCFGKRLWKIYSRRHVSRSSAELSYFLTLSIFPTLICLYAIFGRFIPTRELIFRVLDGIVPTETLGAIGDYLVYVQAHSGRSMLIGAAALMASSSAAAFRALCNIMAEIQGAPKYRGLSFLAASFIMSPLFLAVMYFAVVVIVTGEWFLSLLSKYVPVPWDWSWIRFVILLALLLMLLLGIYRITAPRGSQNRLLPGAVAASTAMVAVGMLFSALVDYSVRYSLVYGSLASMVILMLYLYIFGNILIMGNAINHLIK